MPHFGDQKATECHKAGLLVSRGSLATKELEWEHNTVNVNDYKFMYFLPVSEKRHMVHPF